MAPKNRGQTLVFASRADLPFQALTVGLFSALRLFSALVKALGSTETHPERVVFSCGCSEFIKNNKNQLNTA